MSGEDENPEWYEEWPEKPKKLKCEGCGVKIPKAEIYTDWYHCDKCYNDYSINAKKSLI